MKKLSQSAIRNPQSAILNPLQRLAARIFGLSAVTAVPVGRDDDGLGRLGLGTTLDKTWWDLAQEFQDALDAWRKNPLARRIVGLVSAYVVGDGIRLSSNYGALRKFLDAFVDHEQNHLMLRQPELCDELTRSGELFIVLHQNLADGMSYVRMVPASAIDKIETEPGDYEAELSYHEAVGMDDPDYGRGGRKWTAAAVASVHGGNTVVPVMLHFAINRPAGCVRGESDLAPILPWLKRYSRWLEDRVRLNAAVRAFLWIVSVPASMVAGKQNEYREAPEPGSVIVSEAGAETWEAVAPKLEARDAASDGRAIRWMVVAGGPGIGLVDLGEAEDANFATAKAMGEQRIRFMRRRQAYFGYVLASVALTAYNRAVELGRVRGRRCKLSDLVIGLPDVSSADNAELGAAAAQIASALTQLGGLGLAGPAYRALALRMVLRFAGERVSNEEADAVLATVGSVAGGQGVETESEGGAGDEQKSV